MIPSKTFRYSLKKGMQGHDVWALQIALNEGFVSTKVVEDGEFGPVTEDNVRKWQINHNLTVDGVAGPLTQRSLALTLAAPITNTYKLPKYLMKGLIEGESGYFLGNVNWGVSGGIDCGVIQDRVIVNFNSQTSLEAIPDSRWHDAFSPKKSIDTTAAKLRRKKDEYFGKPGASTHKRAWELAILYHNWEAGAEKLAKGGILSKESAQWVIDIGVRGVSSPADWAEFYIQGKTVYVTDYDYWAT